MARTKEAIVLRLPVNSATKMRTEAGQSEEILACRPGSLPSDNYLCTSWRREVQGFSLSQMIDSTDKQPASGFVRGRVHEFAKHVTERSVAPATIPQAPNHWQQSGNFVVTAGHPMIHWLDPDETGYWPFTGTPA